MKISFVALAPLMVTSFATSATAYPYPRVDDAFYDLATREMSHHDAIAVVARGMEDDQFYSRGWGGASHSTESGNHGDHCDHFRNRARAKACLQKARDAHNKAIDERKEKQKKKGDKSDEEPKHTGGKK